jgi:hypothetical protein
MTKKIAAVAAVAAMAVPAAAVTATAEANPLPPCTQTVVQNAAAFAVYVATYTIDNGRPPFLGGPFLPC